MTSKEIKKAFDICCSAQSCTDCPILKIEKQNVLGCKYNLFTSAIGLITEQEKQIERLKSENAELQKQVNKVREQFLLTCENCHLKKDIKLLQYQKELAVKEFAEKLKENALSHCRDINCYEKTFIETTIDDLLKEYICN